MAADLLCRQAKCSYNFYRGVSTKYLNRYNVLFVAAYTNVGDLITPLLKAARFL